MQIKINDNDSIKEIKKKLIEMKNFIINFKMHFYAFSIRRIFVPRIIKCQL